MTYVSGVETQDGSVDGLMYAALADSGLVSVTVIDEGKVESFTADNIHDADCLGISLSGGAIVRHTAKTAALHRFVDSVWSVRTDPDIDLYCNDYIDTISGVYGLDGHRSLVINMFDNDISIMGRKGSVFVHQSKITHIRDAMTLYDGLGFWCRELRVNLMSYDSVTFYSEGLYYESKVSFVHTKESDRYFAKMYCDVCGGGRQGEVCVRSGV